MRYVDLTHVPMGVLSAAMGASSFHPSTVDVGIYMACYDLPGSVLGIVECVPCADEHSMDRFVWKTACGEALVEFNREDISTLFDAILKSAAERTT